MSSVAIDPVDANWRILRGEEKPLTPRGRSRLSGHRRTRHHDELTKRDGSPKRSGRRIVALARATAGDAIAGLIEALDKDETPARPVGGYFSRSTKAYEALRCQEDTIEVSDRQHDILDTIETQFSFVAHYLQKCHKQEKLERLVAGLRSELLLASTDLEARELRNRLELAELELELLALQLEVLAPYGMAA